MDELVLARKRGFIVGPRETYEEFLLRSRSSIAISYSNKGLSFLQGGCTWIEEGGAHIQLRKAFETKQKLFGVYRKEEIIAHEQVHVARQKFEEKRFEEILAYRTSTSSFRAFLGPLFRNSQEMTFFLLSLSVLFIVNLFYIALALPLFVGLTAFFLLRLCRDQAVFSRCLNKFTRLVKDEKKAFSLLMHLTDCEIECFAKLTEKQIEEKFKSLDVNDLRLKQLQLLFNEFYVLPP